MTEKEIKKRLSKSQPHTCRRLYYVLLWLSKCGISIKELNEIPKKD